MTYDVQVLPVAVRAIRTLPPAARQLTGRPEWRVRTGDYRVLYRIEDGILTVVVVHAGHRREVYR